MEAFGEAIDRLFATLDRNLNGLRYRTQFMLGRNAWYKHGFSELTNQKRGTK
jgi:hypothetical protein